MPPSYGAARRRASARAPKSMLNPWVEKAAAALNPDAHDKPRAGS